MQLSIREAAGLLSVSEREIYRWLDDGTIPACRVGEEARFNREELLEWATLKKLPISPGILEEPADDGSLAKALEAGGVSYDLSASNREEALGALVSALQLPPEADRDLLREMLLSRGDYALTPVGEGIAIPHVRQPAIMAVSRAMVTLFFLKTPIDLKAPDNKPVGILFFLLSPTVRAHLHLFSRLAAALHDAGFKAALARKAGLEDILREARRIEIAP